METTNWRWFKYDELFEIKKGKRLTKANMINGEIPFIGATDSNNGITAHISNNEHLHPANTISVSYNGSIAKAYYQAEPFWATDDVNVLYPKFNLNKFIAFFFIPIISREKYRFNYGRKWDKTLMKQSTIKLPVNSQNDVDWQWIERYVKETILSKLPAMSKTIWSNEFSKTPLSSQKLSLSTKEWQWFEISKLCYKPYKATAYNAIDLTKCNYNGPQAIAYITRTDENNGNKCYVVKDDTITEIEKGNAISIGDTTATIFYQEKDFICGDHIVILRSKFLNKYTGIFLVSLLTKERFRYCYGRAFKKEIIANTYIKLPAIKNSDGEFEPDWQWMEDYIKGLPYSGCL